MKILYALIATFFTYSAQGMNSTKSIEFIPCGTFNHNEPVINTIDTDTIEMPYKYLPSRLFQTDYCENNTSAVKKIDATLVPENCFTIVTPETFGITLPLRPCNGLVITNATKIDDQKNSKTILAHITYRTNIQKLISLLSKIYAGQDPTSLSVSIYSNEISPWDQWQGLIYSQMTSDWLSYSMQYIIEMSDAEIATDSILKLSKSFSCKTFTQKDGMTYLAHRISKTLAIPEKNITVDLIKTNHLARARRELINLFRLPEEMVYVKNNNIFFYHHSTHSFTKKEISDAFNFICNTFKAPLCLAVDHKGNCFNTSYDIENFHQSSILVDDGSTNVITKKDTSSKISLKNLDAAVTKMKNIMFLPGSSPLYEIQKIDKTQQ